MSASRRVFAAAALMVALSSAACSGGLRDGTALPVGSFIMSGEKTKGLLDQCSRGVPAMGEATWIPQARDIAELEQALPAALAATPEAKDTDFTRIPTGWWRQYGGYIRAGRRFIYGNFFTAPDPRYPGAREPDYAREVAVICDGGPVFFGVEWDVEARRFTQLDFNGAV